MKHHRLNWRGIVLLLIVTAGIVWGGYLGTGYTVDRAVRKSATRQEALAQTLNQRTQDLARDLNISTQRNSYDGCIRNNRLKIQLVDFLMTFAGNADRRGFAADAAQYTSFANLIAQTLTPGVIPTKPDTNEASCRARYPLGVLDAG